MPVAKGETLELAQKKQQRTWTRVQFPSVGDTMELDEEPAIENNKNKNNTTTKNSNNHNAEATQKKKRPDSEVYTALCLKAAQSGDVDEIRNALGRGADINEPDEYSKTALHNAVLGNHLDSVIVLLSNGADPQTSDETGETPIHSATRNGNEAIVKELLEGGKCNVNVGNVDNITPFHIAAEIDNLVICKRLIERGADLNARANDGTTPAAKAASFGNGNIVDYILTVAKLIRENMDGFLYKVDKDGSSLLHLAVTGGSKAAVEICLQSGAAVQACKTLDDSTAFHKACGLGSLEIVELLATEDPKVISADLVDVRQATPLHRAAQGKHTDVVQYLVNLGASVNPRDISGKTPLFLAATGHATDIVELLMEKGADATIKNDEKSSVLHEAVGSSSTIEAFLTSPACVNLITDKDVTGHAPIHYAAKKGNARVAAMFLKKNKAAGLVTSDEMNTPLHVCAQYGHVDVAEVLLDKQYMKAPNAQDTEGRTALHYACVEGHDSFVDFLTLERVQLEKDTNARTPLHIAAEVGSERCVESVVDAYVHCINDGDKYQNTALHLAAINGHRNVVKYLLSHKEQEILLNEQNKDVLDVAVNVKQFEVAMEIAENYRWREIITGNPKGVIRQMQILVEKMPDVAEKILDQCVTREGDPADADYKLTYDLTMVHGKGCPKTPKTKGVSLWTIKTMLDLRRDKCLTHPVVFTLLNLKWKKYGFIAFFLSLSTYLAFILPFTSLAVLVKQREEMLCAHNKSSGKAFHDFDFKCSTTDMEIFVLHWIVIVVICLSLMKEFYEFVKKRLQYFLSFDNYAEISCYVLALLYLLPVCECKTFYKPALAAFTIFLGWMILMMYFRRLPIYGTYVIMVVTMFQTLVKVLFLLVLFMITFSTAFYILMENNVAYGSFSSSFMNNFAMTLGELNYKDTFFEGEYIPYPVSMNLLFIIFVLTMPIIMMNMLVGLAVGDIGAIQQNAATSRYVAQVELLHLLEESLPDWIIQTAQVNTFTEYPNAEDHITETLYNKTVGFGRPEDKEPPPVPQEMIDIKHKVEQQEKKIDDIYNMLRQQLKLLRAISQRESGQQNSSQEEQAVKKADRGRKLIGLF